MSKKPSSYNARESISRVFKGSFERCLYAGLECENPPIKAHSIQNAAHLGLLEREGHLVQITRRMEKGAPTLRFDEVGRNRATTFLGLCADHDSQLFRLIEHQPIDPSDLEHLFLLAYRAIHRAAYVEIDTAAKVQRSYLERIEHGVEPGNVETPAAIYATQLLIQAYETYVYKERCDVAYAAQDWKYLAHDVRHLTCQAPSLAVSGFFTPDYADSAEPSYVSLSVFPASRTDTVIVLSYANADARNCRRHFRSLLNASGPRLAYEVSRLVLNSCDNFVLAPAVFNTWPEAKRNAIMNYFRRTLFKNEWRAEIPELNMLLAA